MTAQDIIELVVEPSSYCNSKCPHCPRFTEDGHLHPDLPLGHLTLNMLKGLDVAKLINLQIVTFEGDKGDPVMNPALLDLIALFPADVRINIATNGGIRSQYWWRQLAQIPNVVVNFSIDGLADTNHLYRVDVDYSKVMRNAQAFIEAGGTANWRCLIFQHNQHQIDSINQLSCKLGFSSVQFRMPHLVRFQGLNVWPVKVNGNYLHDLMPTTLSDAEVQSHSKLFRPIPVVKRKRIVNNSRCPWAQHNKLYIDFQAHALPCCMMHFETLNNYPGRQVFSKMVTSFDCINLAHTSLEDIMLLYADKLESSLVANNTMLPVCKKTCFP